MRRVFSILMAIVVLFSMFGLVHNVEATGTITYVESRFVWGKGVVFIFEATGFKNKDLKYATLFVESNDYKLSCWVNRDEEKIICVANGGLTRYAGETGLITLAGRVFTVIIPGRTLPSEEDVPLSCPEGMIPGADVTFRTGGGDTFTFFVPGSPMSDVYDTALGYVDGSDIVGVLSVGTLYCGEEPS